MKRVNLGVFSAMLLACVEMPVTVQAAEITPSKSTLTESSPVKPNTSTREEKLKQAADEELLSDAETLMSAGRPAEAYALLKPAEFARSGERRFDYLLGIAALDSGQPDKATLALERVLAVDPNFAGARLDMARAYYQLGDKPRAKTEFETVMKQNPPPAARATIQKYLDAINSQEQAQRTRVTGYLEGSVGRDSNVNGATSQAQIPVPAFGNLVFTLDPSSMKTSDNYGALAGGGEVNHLIDSGFGFYAGVDARLRRYSKFGTFSSADVAAHAGVSYDRERDAFRVGLIGDQYRLGTDNKPNRNTGGINAEWRHTSSQSDMRTTFGQYTQNRFVASGMETQDFNLSLLGENWLHVLEDGQSAVFGSLFIGHETDVAPKSDLNPGGGRPDGNKNMVGARAGTQFPLVEDWDAFVGGGLQKGQYVKENLAFLKKRSDTMWDVNAGANWHLDKDWSLRPQVTYMRNVSNIPIYSFDRTDVSLMLHRDFK